MGQEIMKVTLIIRAEESRVLWSNKPLEGTFGCIDELSEEIITQEN
jgi:hypothetical protein